MHELDVTQIIALLHKESIFRAQFNTLPGAVTVAITHSNAPSLVIDLNCVQRTCTLCKPEVAGYLNLQLRRSSLCVHCVQIGTKPAI